MPPTLTWTTLRTVVSGSAGAVAEGAASQVPVQPGRGPLRTAAWGVIGRDTAHRGAAHRDTADWRVADRGTADRGTAD
ncbi:hypothetical protein GCM10010389_44200 [Streptomyces echinoruber]|uniref:Uncharacterized protein n=1 Tax=Streptomyces echinoruber TaxID=68898 RepID=A0A918RIJ0_9ACTN|nr:hypothetical protein GCM10010389_44200 [Streptomyces echinoruber]